MEEKERNKRMKLLNIFLTEEEMKESKEKIDIFLDQAYREHDPSEGSFSTSNILVNSLIIGLKRKIETLRAELDATL